MNDNQTKGKVMKELQSLSQKIDEIDETVFIHIEKWFKVKRHNELLKQNISLGQFIPCDEDGNVLEMPKFQYHDPTDQKVVDSLNELIYQFKQASERVIFPGWELQSTNNTRMVIEHKDGHIMVFWCNDVATISPKNKQHEIEVETLSDLVKYKLKLKE